jgi:predicted MFS family arabinose efflux permease
MKTLKIVVFGLFTLISFFLFFNKENITLKPWFIEQTLELIGNASGNGKETAIIADGSETVVVVNNAGELLYKIRAGTNISRSFVSAELVDLDGENNLYVYDKIFGGAFEENTERILKYSPRGEFIGIIYSYSYINEDFIITKGKISGMGPIGDTLYIARLEHDGFYLECIYTKEQNESRTHIFFPYPNAFRELSYCRLNTRSQRIVWTTKTGTILEYSFSGSLINTIPAVEDISPYMTVSDNNENFIYTDILNCQIGRIDPNTGEKEILFHRPMSEANFYYYINYSNNNIYASYNADDVLVIDKDGGFTAIDSYFFSKNDIISRYILFFLNIVDVILLVFMLVWGIIFLSKQKLSGVLKQIILVGICIIFGAIISSIILLNEMQKQYTENTFNELDNISKLISASIDINLIDELYSRTQFTSDIYRNFSNRIKTIFSELQFEGKQVYIIIWIERDGVVYSIYDLEYSWGIFYPIGKHEDSFLEPIYISGQSSHLIENTSSGTWINVIVPIFDGNKNVIAAIETGYNIQTFEKENRRMIIQLMLIVLAATVTLLLIVIECLLMLNAYKKNKNEITGSRIVELKPNVLKLIIGLLLNAYQKDDYKGPEIPLPVSKTLIHHLFNSYKTNKGVSFHPELIRAAAFILYFSVNCATALLPVYAARLYIPVFNLPREFIVTLPFVTQVTFMVSALILIPIILGKAGIKKVSLISAILFFTGNVFCVIAENIIYLSVGYALLGFACGAFGLLFNTIIGAQKNTEDVNNGFAHLNASYLAGVNVGIVSGSIVAQFFPYRTVFWFASGISLLFLAIIIFSIRSELVRHYYDVQFVKEKNDEKFALIKFIFKPVVLCTLFLALMPYVVTMSFTEYFMPVFGMENGLNEANIGQLMLLSGLFTILFGTSLCEFTRKKMPIQIIVLLSCLLNVIAIYLFSLNVSIVMLIISVLIIAIVNIFAFTNIQTYYTLLYQHGNISSVKAFGTYSIVEYSAMAVGPIVFSYILANGISSGMKILAFVIFGCTILFTVTSALYHKKSKIRGFFRRSNDTYGAVLKSEGISERKKK